MAIERDIHELLFEHDCVIVPGFGGLLTHRRSARLDAARHLIHPPAKDLSFNGKLTRNDGLLADRVARRLGLPHDQAVSAIDHHVKQWTVLIEREGRVELPDIGTFFHDREKNLQFEPDRRVNYLKDAYGLRSVMAMPIVKSRVVVEPVVRQLRPPMEVVRQERGRVNAFWAAATITGLLFAAGAFWATRPGAMNGVQMGSFDLFDPSEPATYSVRTHEPLVLEADAENEWSAPVDVYGVHAFPIAGVGGPLVNVDLGLGPAIEVAPMASIADVDRSAAPDKTGVATPTARTSRYHVIGGCFSVKENADHFISDLRGKGFEAVLVDEHRGLYRVAFGSFPERSMALEALAAVRKEEGADAWLLVK